MHRETGSAPTSTTRPGPTLGGPTAFAGAVKTGIDVGKAIWGAAPYIARFAAGIL